MHKQFCLWLQWSIHIHLNIKARLEIITQTTLFSKQVLPLTQYIPRYSILTFSISNINSMSLSVYMTKWYSQPQPWLQSGLHDSQKGRNQPRKCQSRYDTKHRLKYMNQYDFFQRHKSINDAVTTRLQNQSLIKLAIIFQLDDIKDVVIKCVIEALGSII